MDGRSHRMGNRQQTAKSVRIQGLRYVNTTNVDCRLTIFSVLTEHSVRLTLNKQEQQELESGETVMMHEVVSPCGFLMAGLDLKKQQCV